MTEMEKIIALRKITGISIQECKEAVEFVSKHSNQPITAYGYLYTKHLVGARPLTVEKVIVYSRYTKDPWESEDDSKVNT